MKFNAATIVTLAGAAGASPIEPRQGGGGLGPYKPGTHSAVAGLDRHTVYMPKGDTKNRTLPVLVWSNGACSADGTSTAAFLDNVASYGYMAISSGAPAGRGSTTARMMTESIDWVVEHAGKEPYANVNATKIMAAGFSCGGVEAMAQAWDPRVASIGIFSSGLLSNFSAARNFHKPMFYVLGGPGDIAYGNGMRDFNALPPKTPSWVGNLALGHGGDLFSPNGGKFGKAGINWMECLFKGDAKACQYFLTDRAKAEDGWTVATHQVEVLKTFVSDES